MMRNSSLTNILRQASCFIFVFTILPPTIYRSRVPDLKEDPVVAGRKAFERKDFRAALALFRQAANESPERMEAQRWLSFMAAVLGHGEEALRAYQKIASLAPSPGNNYWLGKFAGDIGETSIAVEALQKTLSHSSRDGDKELTQAQRLYVSQYLFRVLLEVQIATEPYPLLAVKAGFRQESTSVSLPLRLGSRPKPLDCWPS
jgi:tetratricopeptide (TPR) repeat protein